MRNKRYPWPTSRLQDPALMHDLFVLSKSTGKPITKIIEAGVRQHVATLRDKMDNK